MKGAHEKALAAWEKECGELRVTGCRAKDLHKKPVRPKKPKAPPAEEPSGGGEDDESSSEDE
ncbi:hypothetical protein K438DRAFT_1821226 [Mycena galopus ATCC 62051]|nr:hypothetical protein K438DRAFT_1821226 [Mycena galopus ATCC 62051]